MFVFEEMRTAIEAAALDRLATVASAIAQAYGAGGLTDEQYEALDGLLAARRRVAHAVPPKVLTLAAACPQLDMAAAPAPAGQGTAPARAHHRTGSRPRSTESAARRRRWAAAGFLPPKLAAVFTPGEQAVLAVVATEVGKRGTCTLAVGHMAALAGVCATVAKRAPRQARTLGLITVEVRRLTGFRNDTNVVRVASRETAAVSGARINLTGKEYQMLELLSLRKGTTLTKEMFLNHLYGGMDEPELKIIDVFICKLRRKLANASQGKNYIETIWGRGYVLREDAPEMRAIAS